MKCIDGIKFVFRSRGLKKGLARIWFILRRFGFTPFKQVKCLKYYIALLRKYQIRANFFIPAVIIKKYSKTIKGLNADSIEWGIHSDAHTDLSVLSENEQKQHVSNAIEIFDRLAIPFLGFRAPYLKINEKTLEVLAQEKRFLYDSSWTVLWEQIYDERRYSYSWAANFYKPKLSCLQKSKPFKVNSILEIPVSLPDDDILVDRDKMDVQEVSRMWSQMLEACVKRNELFVLQLHPERIFDVAEALEDLIKKAKTFDPPIWITTLGDIAKWHKDEFDNNKPWPDPYEAALCISGDIDTLTIFDFLDRLRTW
ncbi:MAG: polysaccharide deacetylase family protein [Candidatus Omnitrophota bacterium]